MNGTILDIKSQELLKLMLKDDEFLLLLLDKGTRELYQRVDVLEDGTLVLGKTKWKWVNSLFNDQKTIAFSDLLMDMIRVLGNANKSDDAKVVFVALSDEFVKNRLLKDDKNELVEQVFNVYYWGYNGKFSSHHPKIGDPDCKIASEGNTVDGYIAVLLAGNRTALVKIDDVEGGEDFAKRHFRRR